MNAFPKQTTVKNKTPARRLWLYTYRSFLLISKDLSFLTKNNLDWAFLYMASSSAHCLRGHPRICKTTCWPLTTTGVNFSLVFLKSIISSLVLATFKFKSFVSHDKASLDMRPMRTVNWIFAEERTCVDACTLLYMMKIKKGIEQCLVVHLSGFSWSQRPYSSVSHTGVNRNDNQAMVELWKLKLSVCLLKGEAGLY